MNDPRIEKIASAVMYEGYILYPYRRSRKNNSRWTFGSLFPKAYSESVKGVEPYVIQSQMLLRATPQSIVSVQARFLQLVDRTIHQRNIDGSLSPVDQLMVNDKCHQCWQEAVERAASVELTMRNAQAQSDFHFPGGSTTEPLEEKGAIIRLSDDVAGRVQLNCQMIKDGVYQLTLRIENLSELAKSPRFREEAILQSMASTHAILTVNEGEFISMIDLPADLAGPAGCCVQSGAWPVLAGEEGSGRSVLVSPIILYDYPRIADESPGELFDNAEIDEILTLRVMTLSDQEKKEASDLDPRAAELIGRASRYAGQDMQKLHGTFRQPGEVRSVRVGGEEVKKGDRVRLRPLGSADAMDIILKGKTATVAAIEQDYENRIYLAVTIDEDPGADLGAAGKIAHRFFFRPEEVMPIGGEGAAT